ncbi:hypothetical protein bcgnr5378_07810 [Bacillus cereus]
MTSTYDVLSDIHLDFWVRYNSNLMKMEKRIAAFTNSLIPETPSSVLVIPGDMGHYNIQNLMFVQKLKETYKYILIVAGNHDYYLVSKKQRKRYEHNSMNRWEEMKGIYSEIEGVHVLEGNTITIEDITFGGTGMWYDFSYAMQKMNKSFTQIESVWHQEMSDASLIKGLPTNTFMMFDQERSRIERIIDDSDVIITHVGPDWSKIPHEYELDITSSFFYFDGSPYFHKLEGKSWVFGHTHVHFDYMKYGCWFINNSLGYPSENIGKETKIVSITHDADYSSVFI